MLEKRYLPTSDISALGAAREAVFLNPYSAPCGEVLPTLKCGMADILDAEARLRRFAPFIARAFPETGPSGGIIESPLTETPNLLSALTEERNIRLFVKRDSELPIAGSVKARGGIYEILKHTEDILRERGLIVTEDDYSRAGEHRELLSKYAVHVGSTGNLGLSIGIISAALGYRVTVHMSADAKAWKKALLRSRGAEVAEYASDYREAVRRGRGLASQDKMAYFVDDENSLALFLGYSVAALRLKTQLDSLGIAVDAAHPLFVYLPCGVGGAPGGITFGLKHVFGDAVHCFFVEPVNAPCMLAAFVKGECVPVSEYGLSGRTEADGLAVGCASALVFSLIKRLADGEFTVSDDRLLPRLRLLYGTEGIFVEPSAAAAICGFEGFLSDRERILGRLGRSDCAEGCSTHIIWATGGGLVPADERKRLLG